MFTKLIVHILLNNINKFMHTFDIPILYINKIIKLF